MAFAQLGPEQWALLGDYYQREKREFVHELVNQLELQENKRLENRCQNSEAMGAQAHRRTRQIVSLTRTKSPSNSNRTEPAGRSGRYPGSRTGQGAIRLESMLFALGAARPHDFAHGPVSATPPIHHKRLNANNERRRCVSIQIIGNTACATTPPIPTI